MPEVRTFVDSEAHRPGAGRRRWEVAVPVALAAIKVAFLTSYALRSRWVMDEFAQGYMSSFLELGLYRAIDPIKTALPQLVLQVPRELLDSAVAILTAWRLTGWLVALLTIGATLFAAHRARRGAVWTSIAALALLSFSNFLEHSYRVRNDSFAVLLAVLAFGASLRERRDARSAWLPGLLGGLAFLCTQKTAYHVGALALGQIVRGWGEGGRRPAAVRLARYGAGASLPLLVYAVGFAGPEFAEVIRAVFLSPVDPSLMSAEFHSDLRRYIAQTLVRNPAAYLVCACGLLTVLARWKELEPRVRGAAVATVLITALVFAHVQPWPYVFVMAIPFLAVWAPHAFDVVPLRRQGLAVAVVVALLSFSFVRNVAVLRDNKRQQFEVVGQAEALLGKEDRYFDGIAMVPNRSIAGRHPWWWWDAPALAKLQARWNAGDHSEITQILRDQPKVWILNYRFRPMEPILMPIWQGGTVRVAANLLLSGREIGAAEEVVFENLWAGDYRLYDASGALVAADPIVDAVPCPAPCRIEDGRRRVSNPLPERVFLLPSDFRPLGPLPHEGPTLDIFARIYDF